MIVDLNLRGKRILVVGGGVVAERKIAKFLADGARITAVSREFTPGIEGMGVALRREDVQPDRVRGLVEGFDVVVAATDDRRLNRAVVEACAGARAMRYAVDDPDVSDFALLATTRLEDIEIGISTKGKSPGMARVLRERVEALITMEDVRQVKLQAYARKIAKERLGNEGRRREALFRIMRDERVKRLLSDERMDEAKALAARIIEAS